MGAQLPRQARAFSSESVQAMTVALLNAYIGRNAEVLHDQVFQLNYIQVEAPPAGASVLTDAKDRIWIASAETFDFSDSIDLAIMEKAAFQRSDLSADAESKVESKASFIASHASGTLQFFLLCSLAVHFTVSGSGGDSGAPNMRLVIVEAEEQDPQQVPNVFAMNRVTLISECRPRTDGLVAPS